MQIFSVTKTQLSISKGQLTGIHAIQYQLVRDGFENLIRPRLYKTFYKFSSAEHEILPAIINSILLISTAINLLNLAECDIFYTYKYENAN